jgi:hypothetical protein
VISVIRAYLVRRFFATYVKRFAAWCQEMYDDLTNMRYLS